MDKTMKAFVITAVAALVVLGLAGCTVEESSRALIPAATASSSLPYQGQKVPVAVGKMVNRSPYLNGVFSSGDDKLGAQATQMLVMHLTQSGRFDVKDRMNLSEAEAEAKWLGRTAKVSGAKLIISGVVTEFGRKETGSVGLFGIVSKSRDRVMYGKISISAIDVLTSDVISNVAGAGEYQLSSSEVLGFGSHAGNDGTQADKVLDLAVRQAVDRLIADLSAQGRL
jgi:curli biogenesis system outer membrane secretion channel CsgG